MLQLVFGCTHFERSYFSAHYLPGLFTANIIPLLCCGLNLTPRLLLFIAACAQACTIALTRWIVSTPIEAFLVCHKSIKLNIRSATYWSARMLLIATTNGAFYKTLRVSDPGPLNCANHLPCPYVGHRKLVTLPPTPKLPTWVTLMAMSAHFATQIRRRRIGLQKNPPTFAKKNTTHPPHMPKLLHTPVNLDFLLGVGFWWMWTICRSREARLVISQWLQACMYCNWIRCEPEM